jgi:hypothetical protein
VLPEQEFADAHLPGALNPLKRLTARAARFLDSELPALERRAVERVHACIPCRRLLGSLSQTIGGLGALRAPAPSDRAETIIGRLWRADGEHGPGRLTVAARDGTPVRTGWPPRPRAAVTYCLQRSQLRFTVPIGLLVGTALSLANKGAMLLQGQIDLQMCVVCRTGLPLALRGDERRAADGDTAGAPTVAASAAGPSPTRPCRQQTGVRHERREREPELLVVAQRGQPPPPQRPAERTAGQVPGGAALVAERPVACGRELQRPPIEAGVEHAGSAHVPRARDQTLIER